MPIGPTCTEFENFQACVDSLVEDGESQEDAEAICASFQQECEGDEDSDRSKDRPVERRFQPANERVQVRLEERQEGELPKIVGYAAVFFDEANPEATQYDIFGDGEIIERIMPGAFTRAISEDDVAGLFNHNIDNLLGRKSSETLTLSEDEIGLRYEITPPDTEIGRQVVESLRRGDMTGSSFAFMIESMTERIEDDVIVQEIREVQLFDVGPVTFPAYSGTSAAVRRRDAITALRTLTRHRRQKQTETEQTEESETDTNQTARARLLRAQMAEKGLDLRDYGLGVESQTETRGENGAGFLSSKIDEMASDDKPRSSLVKEIASNAGVSEESIRAVLRGDTRCPSLDLLRAFAKSLDTSLGEMLRLFEADGCSYK